MCNNKNSQGSKNSRYLEGQPQAPDWEMERSWPGDGNNKLCLQKTTNSNYFYSGHPA